MRRRWRSILRQTCPGKGTEAMRTTRAVIARLEGGRVKPSTRTLARLAKAAGTRLRIRFEPQGIASRARCSHVQAALRSPSCQPIPWFARIDAATKERAAAALAAMGLSISDANTSASAMGWSGSESPTSGIFEIGSGRCA